MTDINSEQNSTRISDSPSVGDRLRLAREAKKMTIAEVAAQLRLTKENVSYLETDQWDQLHGRPYARGYFSSYVNFLGLPHNEMLALFNLEYTTTDPSMDGFKRPDNKSGFPVGSILLLIIICVAAWFTYQYWQEIQTQIMSAKNDAALMEQPGQDMADDAFSTSVVEPLAVEESHQTSPVSSEQTFEAQTMEEPAEQLMQTIESEAGQDGPLQQQEDVNTDVFEEPISSGVEAITETNIFVMKFAEESWLEVTNQHNKKLIHRIVTAGESIELAGEWPLQILLGNATAVTATYGDNTFDISAYSNGNVARFSVGDAAE